MSVQQGVLLSCRSTGNIHALHAALNAHSAHRHGATDTQQNINGWKMMSIAVSVIGSKETPFSHLQIVAQSVSPRQITYIHTYIIKI